MGGVGKTTLLKQINNEFIRASNDFNLVIWIVVSKDHKIQKLQEVMGYELGIASDLWRIKTLTGELQTFLWP
uniref:Putative disease resistance protein At5g63020 n=1 Tax=Rhizophora mucronata TaxID=61149 RepID=A0A2P2LU26_RHIMU